MRSRSFVPLVMGAAAMLAGVAWLLSHGALHVAGAERASAPPRLWLAGATTFENAAHPFLPAFDGKGRMVLGTNPYGNSRFGLVYLDYRENARAQLSLGDVTGYTFDQIFDPEGNLYLGDWNWNRVLIYKMPLGRFDPGRRSGEKSQDERREKPIHESAGR